MNYEKADALTGYDRWFRYWMPYSLMPISNKIYMPVNRDYKPLGIITDDFIDYEPYAESHGMRFSRDPATFKDVWHAPDAPLSFYNDDPKTRVDYFIRLDRLLARAVRSANRVAIEGINRQYD